MKIVLTLLVRDEIDIIESTLRYHLDAGIDLIIATDNGSVDGTTEVLKRYEKTGRLAYLYEPPSDFSQHTWVTRMARSAYEVYRADWVINGDADEFFMPTHGSLKTALQDVPKEVGVVAIGRHDFVPFERPYQDAPVVEMIYRKRETVGLSGRPRSPKVIHRGVEDIVVEQGNHHATSRHFEAPVFPLSTIELFHYPIRSFPQFESKVRNGGSGYARNIHLHKQVGSHKRYWYSLLVEGKLEEEYQRHFYDVQRFEASVERADLIKECALRDALCS